MYSQMEFEQWLLLKEEKKDYHIYKIMMGIVGSQIPISSIAH